MWTSLFPETCPACRGPTAAGFCAGCRREFARVESPCALCGLPRPVESCPRDGLQHVAGIVAPYAYAYPLSHYLQALKFKQGRRLGRALGLLLAEAVGRDIGRSATLVAVPLHRERLYERGYNQALEIARGAAAGFGLAVRNTGLARIRAAPPQSSLGARSRRTNLAQAYSARGDFGGVEVCLVDDVVTTGATVDAAAAALLAAGAVRVTALAVARTLPPTGAPRPGR